MSQGVAVCNCLPKTAWPPTFYIDTSKPSLTDTYNLVDTPLNRLTEKDLRPAPESIDQINALMFKSDRSHVVL